jgi:hypothetical protein
MITIFELISKDLFQKLPFNYRYLTIISRESFNEVTSNQKTRTRKSTVEVEVYNTNYFLVYHHYNPISKIVNLDKLKNG